MAPPPTTGEICEIARRAVSILGEYGYECCLFGSAACALYGVTRCPKDVDLIVLADADKEHLKRLLANSDDPFFLVPSKNRNAGYEVLWYELPTTLARRGGRRKCKVDILVPGVINIPDVPLSEVQRKDGLPVMPLLPLLFLKLQGWTDHRASFRRDYQRKQHVDVEDIKALLSIACSTGTHVDRGNYGWMPESFIRAANGRIIEWVKAVPQSVAQWETLGFQFNYS